MNTASSLDWHMRSTANASDSQLSTVETPIGLKTLPLAGVWISEMGARYLSDGREFLCISVLHSHFIGWVGKTAIRDIDRAGEQWSGIQAIRHAPTGRLSHWVPLRLTVEGDVLTKSFPPTVPGLLLVHGHIERYRRVRLFDS